MANSLVAKPRVVVCGLLLVAQLLKDQKHKNNLKTHPKIAPDKIHETKWKRTHIFPILVFLEEVLVAAASVVLLFSCLHFLDLDTREMDVQSLSSPPNTQPHTFPWSNSSSQWSLPLFRLSLSNTSESMAFLPPSQDFTA